MCQVRSPDLGAEPGGAGLSSFDFNGVDRGLARRDFFEGREDDPPIRGDAAVCPANPANGAGGFVFVSGQASTDEQGNLVLDTFENEMRRALDHLRAILAAAGLTFREVVQVRGYVTDPVDLPEYNRIYREYFREPYPARVTIGVASLPRGAQVEIDAVMVLEGGASGG